jgi:hypothetical protein
MERATAAGVAAVVVPAALVAAADSTVVARSVSSS